MIAERQGGYFMKDCLQILLNEPERKYTCWIPPKENLDAHKHIASLLKRTETTQ